MSARYAADLRNRGGTEAVISCMQLRDFDPPKAPAAVTSNELRDNISEVISYAAFGKEPVVFTRRGRKMAAIISLEDLAFLERMKKHRDTALSEKVPTDTPGAGRASARRLELELFYG